MFFNMNQAVDVMLKWLTRREHDAFFTWWWSMVKYVLRGMKQELEAKPDPTMAEKILIKSIAVVNWFRKYKASCVWIRWIVIVLWKRYHNDSQKDNAAKAQADTDRSDISSRSKQGPKQ